MSEEIYEEAEEASEIANEDADETEVLDESEEVEATDEDVEGEEEPEELDVVELDGKQYEVPKALKDAVLRQEDYTKKTQAVAEERKAVEQERVKAVEYVKTQEALIEDRAAINAIDARLKDFETVDWNAFIEQDPVTAQKYQIQYQQLRTQREQAVNSLNEKGQQFALNSQQELAKAIEEGEKVLSREIKGWGHNLDTKLQKFAADKFGFEAEDVRKSKANPRLIKLLHMAYQGDQLLNKATKQTVKPVTNIKAKSVTNSKDPSKMSMAEFTKWRRGTIKKRGHG